MFITALFTTVKRWKPKCPPNIERINKMWYIHMMEYYSAIKRNKLLIFTTLWMNSETLC